MKFTGAIKGKGEIKVAKKILAPKPRENMVFWEEEHKEHIKSLEQKEARCIIIGDSIMKHLDKSIITKKKEWKSAGIANFGIRGDRIENTLYRIQDYPTSSEIKKVLIAVGTDNNVRHSEEEIITTNTYRDIE